MLKIYLKLRQKLAEKRGQNTVEYLLIMAAVVGLALAVGMAMKGGLTGVWDKVKAAIESAIGSLAG